MLPLIYAHYMCGQFSLLGQNLVQTTSTLGSTITNSRNNSNFVNTLIDDKKQVIMTNIGIN